MQVHLFERRYFRSNFQNVGGGADKGPHESRGVALGALQGESQGRSVGPRAGIERPRGGQMG